MKGPKMGRVPRACARGLVVATAIVLLAASGARAAEVMAELDVSAPGVSVPQGGTVSFALRVKAGGSIRCVATASNPATATFDIGFEVGPTGAASSHGPTSAVPFWGGLSTGGSNCQVTWEGDPTWVKVPMTVHADPDAPLGDVLVRLRPALSTPFGSGDRLTDASPAFLTFSVVPGADTTPPTVTCEGPAGAQGAHGWYLGPVSWSCGADDAESGLADPDDAAFTLDTTGEGERWTGNRVVVDAAGNEAHAGPFGAYRIDMSDPTIDVTSPAADATFVLGSDAPAVYACDDAVSGIASCGGSVGDGELLDTSSLGVKTVVFEAVDEAGRVSVVARSYTVVYDFDGPTVTGGTQRKAGATIPLFWSLGGIDDPGSLSWAGSTPCGADPAAAAALASPGASGLTYDVATDRFHLNWKTDKSWTGCRTLLLGFRDGTTHGADVWFR